MDCREIFFSETFMVPRGWIRMRMLTVIAESVENVSIAIGVFVKSFCTCIHGSQRTNPEKFCDADFSSFATIRVDKRKMWSVAFTSL